MPVFKVDVEKTTNNEYWTNRYFVMADNLTAARDLGGAISVAEQAFHASAVKFTRFRVSDLEPDSDVYVTVPVNASGLQADDTSLLPLFNVLRVDFGPPVGRPSRKFYRGVLRETHINGDAVSGLIIDLAVNALTPLLSQGLVDIDGQIITSVRAALMVGMRQLRRGSKRRANPILP